MDCNSAHSQIHEVCLVEVYKASHNSEENGHDEGGPGPADILKRTTFLPDDGLNLFGVPLLLFRDSAKLSKCVNEVCVAQIESLIRDGGLQKSPEWRLHVFEELLLHFFIALVAEDLKPQVQQNVFQQFYF